MAQYLLPKLLNIKCHEDLFHVSQAVMFVETERWHNFDTPPAGMLISIKVTAVSTANICFPTCKMKLAQVKWDHIFQFLPMTCRYKCLITFREHMSINLLDLLHVRIHFVLSHFRH